MDPLPKEEIQWGQEKRRNEHYVLKRLSMMPPSEYEEDAPLVAK